MITHIKHNSSPEEIKRLLIQTITSYNNDEITLKELVSLVEAIKNTHNIFLTGRYKKIIDELSSLSVIDDILNDIANELMGNG
jgi:hypothetical protein